MLRVGIKLYFFFFLLITEELNCSGVMYALFFSGFFFSFFLLVSASLFPPFYVECK